MTALEQGTAPLDAPVTPARPSTFARLAKSPSVLFGGVILAAMLLVALLAPVMGTANPAAIDPTSRNKYPGAELSQRDADGNRITRTAWMGTDSLGRDVYSRVIYGTRVSLAVGVAATAVSVAIGLSIGLVAGYVRWLDAVVMRFMDGMMAIPGILLAIALVSLWGAGLATVILAVAVPEIPRVVRLVRSVVLTVRALPYIEAAIASGTRGLAIMARHVLPNTIAPLIVQATYVCASAILLEAGLSFLGAGTPPEIPSWGNVISDGRTFFQIAPWIIFFPGVLLAVTVLAINLVGDGLRDTLDPRIARRM